MNPHAGKTSRGKKDVAIRREKQQRRQNNEERRDQEKREKRQDRKERPAGHQEQHEQMVRKLNPELRKEMEALRAHDRQITERLQDEGTARLFLSDPGGALRQLKIPVGPLLKDRLKLPPPPDEILNPKGYRLPTGQVVRPKVRIRFVSMEGGKDAGH